MSKPPKCDCGCVKAKAPALAWVSGALVVAKIVSLMERLFVFLSNLP